MRHVNGLLRIIDQHNVSTEARHRTTHGGGKSSTMLGRLEHGLSVFGGTNDCSRKCSPVPIRRHNRAGVVGQLISKILRVASAYKFFAGNVSEHERGPRDRNDGG